MFNALKMVRNQPFVFETRPTSLKLHLVKACLYLIIITTELIAACQHEFNGGIPLL